MQIEDWKHLSFPVAATDEDKAAVDESRKSRTEQEEDDMMQEAE
jgi:hypothetical protein